MSAETQPVSRKLCANVIRGLAMDAVQKANSGHPGMPMGMADIAAALWLDHLRYDPADPQWAGRDRFVLSAGHGSMLLYSLLHLAGFELSMKDLQAFRQLHSKTPGHPEYGMTPGVETTTGPLGQGFANGVGMALAARMEAARFGCPLADRHRVFAIVGDGCLMEGVSAEAASLAGHLKLSNLIYLWDDNRITIDGKTDITFSEDVGKRFEAYGWRVIEMADGHDPAVIDRALAEATAPDADRPTLVKCRTHIAYGSPNKQDSSSSHGSPLGADELAATKKALGLPEDSFWVPDEVRDQFATAAEHKQAAAQRWREEFSAWEAANHERAEEHRIFTERRLPEDLLDQLLAVVGDDDGATRALSGQVIQAAAKLTPCLVTGSADLEGSCKTAIKDSGFVAADDFNHRSIHFGVREHAMGSLLNGMAVNGGFLPVGSTFLVFADYMRPPIRLAALMAIPTTFVFTHDSLYVGEDGPTHQPVEQAMTLRAIPHLHVIRPADGREVAAAWTHALSRRQGPVSILLSRQGLPTLPRPEDFDNRDLMRGAYVLHEPKGKPQGTVIATGSEVSVTLEAVQLLAEQDIALRLVSMPCIELFVDQPREYRDTVLRRDLPIFAVELGRPEPFCQFTGDLEKIIGLQRFGESAPGKDLQEEFGFTAVGIAQHLRAMLG